MASTAVSARATPAPGPTWRSRLARAAAIVRRIIGAPDYDTYLAYMRVQHPQCTPLDPQSFATERYTAKYTRAGQRCC
jgi:uncharacterized short protein YbdD (DUF466 family)